MKPKIAGAIALVAVLAIGAWALYGGTGTATGSATISASLGTGTVWAATEPATSGIENIVIMDSGASYNESNRLSGSADALAVIESNSGSVNIDYDTPFDIVAQVKGHDDNMAYVSVDNMAIELEVTGDITVAAENVGETVFDNVAGTYIRVNGSSASFDGLSLSADQSCTINLKLWLYA